MLTTTSRDGTAIAYDRMGSGVAVVVVGGGPTTRVANGQLAGLLAERFTVFNYDRRGRGDSGDTAPYAVRREYEDLAAVIEAAGGSAFVVGSSGGAVLALRAAAAGVPIIRLALWEPSYIVAGTRPVPGREYKERLEALIGQGRPGDALELFFTDAVGLPAEVVSGLRMAPFWAAMEALAPTLVYDATVAGDFSVPAAALASLTVPVHVLDGGTTPWLSAAAQAVAAALPVAQRAMLRGQQHAVEATALARAIIAAFTDDGAAAAMAVRA